MDIKSKDSKIMLMMTMFICHVEFNWSCWIPFDCVSLASSVVGWGFPFVRFLTTLSMWELRYFAYAQLDSSRPRLSCLSIPAITWDCGNANLTFLRKSCGKAKWVRKEITNCFTPSLFSATSNSCWVWPPAKRYRVCLKKSNLFPVKQTLFFCINFLRKFV